MYIYNIYVYQNTYRSAAGLAAIASIIRSVCAIYSCAQYATYVFNECCNIF